MSAPLISVIVPCYNGGRFLDGLLASLRAQTFQDFEVVIVDDGSTEEATLLKLKELESFARVVYQENRHLPGARNTGFREARAEIVLPLDCDDRLEPTFLDEVYIALRNAPDDVGFVFTHMRLAGGIEGIFRTHCNRFDQLFLNHMAYCLLVRKSAWQAVGGYDENMRDGSEDWAFNLALLRAGYRSVEVARPLFIYAIRTDGMLLSRTARMQATTWRQIRNKYPDLYRLTALVKAWRECKPGWRSTAQAGILMTLVSLLPENLCNALFFRMNMFRRRRRIARRELRLVES